MTLNKLTAINLLLTLLLLGTAPINAIKQDAQNAVNLVQKWNDLRNYVKGKADLVGPDITTQDYANFVVMDQYFGTEHDKDNTLHILYKKNHEGGVEDDLDLSTWIALQQNESTSKFVPQIVDIMHVKDKNEIIVTYKKTMGSIISKIYNSKNPDTVPDQDLVSYLRSDENRLRAQAAILQGMHAIESFGYHNCGGNDHTFHYMPIDPQSNNGQSGYNFIFTELGWLGPNDEKCRAEAIQDKRYADPELVTEIDEDESRIKTEFFKSSSRFSTGMYIFALESYLWSAYFETSVSQGIDVKWIDLPTAFDGPEGLLDLFKEIYAVDKPQNKETFSRYEDFHNALEFINVENESFTKRLFSGEPPHQRAPIRFVFETVQQVINNMNIDNLNVDHSSNICWFTLSNDLRYLGKIFTQGVFASNDQYYVTDPDEDEGVSHIDYEYDFDGWIQQGRDHMVRTVEKLPTAVVKLTGFVEARKTFEEVADVFWKAAEDFENIKAGFVAADAKAKELIAQNQDMRRERRLVLV